MKSRRLTHPWPFPVSVIAGKSVRNIQPKPPKRPKPARLKRVPPSDTWVQEGLL